MVARGWLRCAIWQRMPWAIDKGRVRGMPVLFYAIKYDGHKISERRPFREFAAAFRWIEKRDRRRRRMRAQRLARRKSRG